MINKKILIWIIETQMISMHFEAHMLKWSETKLTVSLNVKQID